jgi:hypothetical protein
MVEEPKAPTISRKTIKVAATIKPINDSDIVTLMYQASEYVGADEPGPSGQQDSHLGNLFSGLQMNTAITAP